MSKTPRHILKVIEAERAAKTGTLDLSLYALSELPEEVYGLAHIKTLKLNSASFWINRLNARFIQYRRNSAVKISIGEYQAANIPNVPLLFLEWDVYKKNRCYISKKNVAGLRFNRKNVKQSRQLVKFSGLSFLDFSSCRIKSFPKEIVGLRRLTSLDLSSNQLTEIPKRLVRLQNLTLLDLSSNRLTKIPKRLARLR